MKASYDPSQCGATISYTLTDSRKVHLNVFDQQGRNVAAIVDNVVAAGRHRAFWKASRVPAGMYVWQMTVDGRNAGSGRIVVGR